MVSDKKKCVKGVSMTNTSMGCSWAVQLGECAWRQKPIFIPTCVTCKCSILFKDLICVNCKVWILRYNFTLFMIWQIEIMPKRMLHDQISNQQNQPIRQQWIFDHIYKYDWITSTEYLERKTTHKNRPQYIIVFNL